MKLYQTQTDDRRFEALSGLSDADFYIHFHLFAVHLYRKFADSTPGILYEMVYLLPDHLSRQFFILFLALSAQLVA